MEIAIHGSKNYPFRYYYENLALFDFGCVNWHWHSEFEFVYIENGNVSFDVGADGFELGCGQGILINSKILHRLQSKQDAIIPNFLFHPSFVAQPESLIYEKFVSPILSSPLEYIVFHENVRWQAEALHTIKKIIALQDAACNCELAVSIYIQQLFLLLHENVSFESSDNKAAVISRTRLQLMMQYIHTHYSESISLEDIAKAAAISISSALHIFQSGIKMTPVNYLISYRLKQAASLLKNTEKTVADISMKTGFNGVDHFCRSFKKAYGMTPTDYRK